MASVSETGCLQNVETRLLGSCLKGYTVFQKGDVLVLPVISRSSTGATIYAGTGGTGCVTITGPNAANCSVTGRLGQLVIEFTNVSSGALGVTGSYVVYGGQISN
jgi:hypothetical protein